MSSLCWLRRQRAPGYTYLFGAIWGLGGLTFGLTMRYLGMSLGMAVALGYCTVFGTLIPPIFKGEFHAKLIAPAGGRWVLAGLLVCVVGIVINALAGKNKDGEMSAEQKKRPSRSSISGKASSSRLSPGS